ncbi:MAG: UDP-N-acetylmuramoyl-tripeptide--D-alanyl-D-alanine ligase [Bacteroidales bacterium]|jgi:UDP-N-acetylmuramoyl-tripeptide--D-alanyl-D-alanine ligase|nr:UDP-N-acetylmuramoyl-tripeptide--D-alanyl-D-alanine ligase [Bacteroidales bacterium]
MTINELYKIYQKHPQITTDSRFAPKNGLFFALKGEHFDGNVFAQKAIENGCAYAIIDNPKFFKSKQFILVEDVLSTLQQLANYHRQQLKIPVIGITGTNGKTTTKELLASVLSMKYNVAYTQGNLNNHIGVPLTILSFTENTELGIVEMGANHLGEIKNLCAIADPGYGLITNIGKAHLEGFRTFDNIIKTKNELYDYITQNNGQIFYNAKDQILSQLIIGNNDAVSYGDQKESKVYGIIKKDGIFLKLEAVIEKKSYNLKTKLIGDYNIDNVLAAIAIGNYFNVDDKKIIKAIERYKPDNNRSQFFKTRNNNLFLDAYNANPISMKAAIKNFEQLDIPHKSLILGDMFELGDNALNDHYDVMNNIDHKNYENIFLVGELFASLKVGENILQFANVDLFKDWLNKNPVKGSNILIKGSRGNRLERIIEFL